MIDPRLAWLAIGALFGAALFGWPWHPRFSRYSRRGSNPPPPGRKPAPPAGTAKPEPHGGQLFVNGKPQFPPPTEIIEDFWPRSSNQAPTHPAPPMTPSNDQPEVYVPLPQGSVKMRWSPPASSIPDWRIRQLAAEGMISPFEPGKVRQVGVGNGYGAIEYAPAISHGCSSYGYDLTLSRDDFRIFQHVPGLIVDPKNFDERCLVQARLHHDEQGSYFILPGHTYGLGVARERLRLPANVTAQFIGKSTYARCGVIVNLTPGEAGWEGYLTLEISNSSGADCRIYANEGICQALFYEGVACDTPYGDGKYQRQEAGVTLARI